MTLVALDTSVLLYLLPSAVPAGQEEMAQDARQLFGMVEQYEFAITTPTIAEVLVAIPDDKRDAVARELERMFRVYAFDTDAAVVAARLWQGRVRSSASNDRQVVKVDLQIAATALRWNAKAFCTFDEQQLKRVQAVAPGLQVGPPIVFLPGQKRLPFR